MLPSCFDYIFGHLRQNARLRPELSPKFFSTLGPNPSPTRKAQADLQLWGAKSPAVGQFFGKNSYFNAIGSHLASVQSHLKALDFDIIESQLKK